MLTHEVSETQMHSHSLDSSHSLGVTERDVAKSVKQDNTSLTNRRKYSEENCYTPQLREPRIRSVPQLPLMQTRTNLFEAGDRGLDPEVFLSGDREWAAGEGRRSVGDLGRDGVRSGEQTPDSRDWERLDPGVREAVMGTAGDSRLLQEDDTALVDVPSRESSGDFTRDSDPETAIPSVEVTNSGDVTRDSRALSGDTTRGSFVQFPPGSNLTGVVSFMGEESLSDRTLVGLATLRLVSPPSKPSVEDMLLVLAKLLGSGLRDSVVSPMRESLDSVCCKVEF